MTHSKTPVPVTAFRLCSFKAPPPPCTGHALRALYGHFAFFPSMGVSHFKEDPNNFWGVPEMVDFGRGSALAARNPALREESVA